MPSKLPGTLNEIIHEIFIFLLLQLDPFFVLWIHTLKERVLLKM
jgi:hypothetical protein